MASASIEHSPRVKSDVHGYMLQLAIEKTELNERKLRISHLNLINQTEDKVQLTGYPSIIFREGH